jgi:predicted lipoprotein with Yx(FWY)xxD motif
MKSRTSLLILVGVFAAAVSAAAISATAAIAAPKATVAAAGATVTIANSPLGKILVDGKGRTLYDFPPDARGASTCYGACAALWPPLTTNGKPKAGPGAKAPLLGTTKRSDGKVEVTYGGHPLYYYVADTKRGETTGQGLNQFGAPWWVISPAGNEIHRG